MPRTERSNPGTRRQAIKLRKDSTPAEGKLWSCLRNDQLGVAFRRQHAIGNYIPDFCCPKKKLVIELDGSQHLEQEEYDEERTKYLESQGYKVIRFWNNDVINNIDGVIRAIILAMEPESHSKQETRNMADIKYEIVKKIGVLSTAASGWAKELNLISWNERDPKYDIREWSPDRGKMGKGVTLSREELMALKELLNTMDP
jgi:very-short-patch-repair endonuclease